jgi:glutaredoxin
MFTVFCPNKFTCPWCEKSKMLLKLKKLPFHEVKTDDLSVLRFPDGTVQGVPANNKNFKGYPQIYLYNSKSRRWNRVGGFSDLANLVGLKM